MAFMKCVMLGIPKNSDSTSNPRLKNHKSEDQTRNPKPPGVAVAKRHCVKPLLQGAGDVIRTPALQLRKRCDACPTCYYDPEKPLYNSFSIIPIYPYITHVKGPEC